MPVNQRRPELDVLRCVAVVLVLFRHLDPLPASDPWAIRVPLKLLFEAGWMGVDLFFVLSGFLVSGLLFREYQERGRLDVKRFLIRRGLKIYPGFYALIGATVGIAIINGWHLPWKRILSEVFFVQNYHQGLYSQTWSLAVEEHFYLLLPVLLLGLLRFGKNRPNPFAPLPWIYIGTALVLLGLRLGTGWRHSFQFEDVGTFCYRHLTPSHLRMDSLLLGVVLGYWHHFRPEQLYAWVRTWRPALLIVAVAAFIPSMFWPLMTTPWLYTVGYLYVALGAAALLLFFVDSGVGSGPLVRGAAYVGSHSYSIYLWHACVALLADAILLRRLHWPLMLHHGMCVLGSIVVGIAMANLIEIPVLHVRDRLFPSRSRELLTPTEVPQGEAPGPVSASVQPR